MEIIKWGFIGCGEVTEKKSGPAFSMVKGSQVVAVMSRNADKARDYASRHDIKKWYNDAQSLVDDDEVNAIYIATPPSSHATFAIMSMKAGKPVYVEKPLAASYQDCARINYISEKTGVPCFVAYYRRYLPYFLKVKEILDSGAIGKIVNLQVRFAVPPRDLDKQASVSMPWRIQPDIAGGGYFYDLAPHQLDLLQFYFGVITHAFGMCANRSGLYDVEDCVSACFRFEDGLIGSGSWSFTAYDSAREDCIDVIGEKGQLAFSVYNYFPIRLYTKGLAQEITVENPLHVQYPLIKNVVEHLQRKAVCTCTSISATPVNWVMDRILEKI